MTYPRICIQVEQLSGNPRVSMDWTVEDAQLEDRLKLLVERWRERFPTRPNPTQATPLD